MISPRLNLNVTSSTTSKITTHDLHRVKTKQHTLSKTIKSKREKDRQASKYPAASLTSTRRSCHNPMPKSRGTERVESISMPFILRSSLIITSLEDRNAGLKPNVPSTDINQTTISKLIVDSLRDDMPAP